LKINGDAPGLRAHSKTAADRPGISADRGVGKIRVYLSVESASRSLSKPTPQKVEQLINELIEERIADGQLDECDLTLGDLRIIAKRFRFTLMTNCDPPVPAARIRVYARLT